MSEIRIRLLCACALTALAACSSFAQQAPAPGPQLFTSKPIVVIALTGDEKREVILMSVSIQPTGAVPMHTHPGDCVGSVVEGAVELLVEGQPAKRVAAGEAYSNVRGVIHGFRNVGDTPARLLNSLVVDKGSPPVQPVARPSRP